MSDYDLSAFGVQSVKGKLRALPDGAEPRNDTGYVGLRNQGATCYLNSFLQTLFMTPELRSGIFSLDPSTLGLRAEELAPSYDPETTDHGQVDRSAAARPQSPVGSESSNKAVDGEEEIFEDALSSLAYAAVTNEPVRPTPPEIPPDILEALTGMGFSEKQARRAYRAHPHPSASEARVDYILSHMDDDNEYDDAPPPEPTPARGPRTAGAAPRQTAGGPGGKPKIPIPGRDYPVSSGSGAEEVVESSMGGLFDFDEPAAQATPDANMAKLGGLFDFDEDTAQATPERTEKLGGLFDFDEPTAESPAPSTPKGARDIPSRETPTRDTAAPMSRDTPARDSPPRDVPSVVVTTPRSGGAADSPRSNAAVDGSNVTGSDAGTDDHVSSGAVARAQIGTVRVPTPIPRHLLSAAAMQTPTASSASFSASQSCTTTLPSTPPPRLASPFADTASSLSALSETTVDDSASSGSMSIVKRSAKGGASASAAPVEPADVSATSSASTSHVTDLPVLIPADDAAAAAGTPAPGGEGRRRDILIELQALFAELQLREVAAVSTKGLTGRGFDWHAGEQREQHDVQELNRILVEAIERELRGTERASLIRDLYQGMFVNKIICKDCGNVSEREEEFLDVVLPIKDAPSLPAALQTLVAFETLSGDNQYSCGRCDKKVDALKGASFRKLPSVLTLSLSRFEYDYNIDKRVKINSLCPFPLVLDMALYREDAASARATRPPATTTTDSTSTQPPPAASSTPPAPKSASAPEGVVQDVVDAGSTELYDLYSVLIHQGGAYGGHYHAYIYDYLGRDRDDVIITDTALGRAQHAGATNLARWHDFDDANVRPLHPSDVARQYGGREECAYTVVYRRRDTVSGLSNLPAHSLQPPAYLRERMAFQNSKFAEQRSQYAELRDAADVTVQTSARYHVWEGRIATRKEKAGAEQKKLRVNLGHTVDAFCQQVREVFGGAVPEAAAIVLHQPLQHMGRLRLNRISGHKGGATTLREAGVTDGMTLLAWNGADVDGVPWSGAEERAEVEVLHYTDASDCTAHARLSALLPEDSDMATLQRMVADLTGIPVEEQLLCRSDYHGVRSFTEREADPRAPIRRAGLLDGIARMTVERRGGEGQPLAVRHHEQKRDTVTVLITDEVSKGFARGPMSISVSLRATVGELRQLAYSKLPAEDVKGVPLSAVKLNRVSGGVYGHYFPSDTMLLGDAGVVEGERMTLEKGRIVGDTVTIRFVIGSRDGATDPLEISCGKTATLADIKLTIGGLMDLDPATFRLCKTDLWGKRDRPFPDEAQTMAEAEIGSDDVLWVEMGRPPVEGQVSVRLELYMPTPEERRLAEHLSSWAGPGPAPPLPALEEVKQPQPKKKRGKNLDDDVWDDAKEAPEPRPDGTPYDDDVALTAAYDPVARMLGAGGTHTAPAPNAAVALASPVLRSVQTDDDLFAYLGETETTLFASLDEFRAQVAGIIPRAQNDGSRVRVWNGNTTERVMRGSEATLGSFGVVDGQCLTVQVLTEPDGVTEEDILLYVHQRRPLLREWTPGTELRFPAGPAPTYPELLTFLSSATDIPTECIYAAKFDLVASQWKPLLRAEDKVDPIAAAAVNLRDKPSLLRHGDIIGVKDVREDPADNDDFSAVRFEDFSLDDWQDAPGGSKGKRPAEARLRIRGDDFGP